MLHKILIAFISFQLPQQQQYAQIITPNGQIQTVQFASLAQMGGNTLTSTGQTSTSNISVTNTSNASGTSTVSISASNDGLHLNTVESNTPVSGNNSASNQSSGNAQQNQQQLQNSSPQFTIAGKLLFRLSLLHAWKPFLEI